MARRPTPGIPGVIRSELETLIKDFDHYLRSEADLRPTVQALVPAFHRLRDLGASLVPAGRGSDAARQRILFYLRRYACTIVAGDELMVVSGIGEWARRVRELRKEYGYRIISGKTAQEMVTEEGEQLSLIHI